MSSLLQTRKLSEIAELNPRLNEFIESDAPVSFVPMSAVTAETASTTTGEERRYAEVSKGYTPFLNGDVLLAKITPCFENGKIAQATLSHRIGFGSTEFHVIRPHLDIADARYLLYFLRQQRIRRDGERKMTGSAGQRRVPEHFLAALEIPLPPLAEQQRIAEVLDRAEALRAKRRAALAELDILTQAIFLDMYKRTLSKSQPLPLVQIAEATRGSFVNGPFGSDLLTSELQDSGVPVIYIRDIRNGEYQRVSKSYVSEVKARDLAVCSVHPGNVLIAKVGDPPGISAIYPEDEPLGVVTQDVIRIRVSRKIALPEFVVGYLNSSIGKWKIAGITIEATRARFSLGDFKAMVIEIPPIEDQQTYAKQIQALERLKKTHRNSLAELDALFAALQHRAFRGEL
jgi:type I restriction enzyme, S subunit